MVTTAATSAFLPIASPASDSSGKTLGKVGGSIPANVDARVTSAKSKSSSSGKLRVNANAQAPPKVNGTKVGVIDGPKAEDEDGLVFRQNFSIRSYEIGADRTASVETLMNHLQETALNHVKDAGLLADGFGSTPEMCKRNLIWVVTKMQVLVDRYPTWGDVVQVDTWVAASGKNGMRRDWLVRDSNTGDILTRATRNVEYRAFVVMMMNKETRRLSKIPDEVREEIGGYFVDSPPIVDDDSRKLPKLDDNTADYIRTGLTPRWSDLDVNQHVNNVKYVGWVLESAPLPILETHELAGMTLEYRRECMRDSVLQSLTAVVDKGVGDLANSGFVECQHLLRLEGGGEIVKGRTQWRPKYADRIGSWGELPAESA
ncbi:Palmitoyl-acyl carrier protein thioesterase, chloroplastic [Sesamum angolense]|uniref:Acyl-[acyl-carrier-protein] hydrolase n=1 Tax=Sesamum angolense TaxID=2727404 RepID=A0AAE1WE84_9LAMI|nr:Palmitoyl-acyl carrier protein thioesterase, chloroplastic [Sesamum angolense]